MDKQKKEEKAQELFNLHCGSAGHVSQESVKRYIQEQEGKKVFDYDIFECPEELKGQLKIGDFFG